MQSQDMASGGRWSGKGEDGGVVARKHLAHDALRDATASAKHRRYASCLPAFSSTHLQDTMQHTLLSLLQKKKLDTLYSRLICVSPCHT
jgi:hypothetical protein